MRIIISAKSKVNLTVTPSLPIYFEEKIYKGEKGDKGDTGATGSQGLKGDTGAGIAVGGTAGQILSKIDSTDFNTQWINNFVLPSLTSGSVLFSNGTTVAQNNANFFWNNANNRLGIGTTTPSYALHVNGVTGATTFTIPSYNSQLNQNYLMLYGGYGAGIQGTYNNPTGGDLTFGTFINSIFNEKMRLLPSGNLGIGTTTPGNKLSIVGAATIGDDTIPILGANGGKFSILNGGGSGYYGLLGGVIGTGQAFLQVQRVDGTATPYNLLLQPNGGNIGVGTLSPGGTLDVAGALSNNKSFIRVTNTDTANYITIGAGIPTITNAGMNFTLDGISKMVISSAGNLGIGETSPLTTLDIRTSLNTTITPLSSVPNASTTVLIGNTGTNGVLAIGHNNTGKPWLQGRSRLAGAAAEDILINPLGGNVGIGTTTPTAKLDILDTVLAGSAALAGSVLNLAQTWNTTGVPTALLLNVTDTASNGSSKLFDFQVGGLSQLTLFKDGRLQMKSNTALNSAGNSVILRTNLQGGTGYNLDVASYNNFNTSSLAQGFANFSGNIFYPAGTGVFKGINVTYTINNPDVQTGTATGIFLNATETALNGMVHNLMDLQVGSVSKFRVTNSGTAILSGLYVNGLSNSFINSTSNGTLVLYNSGGTDFNRIQLGGTTNLFPAIKRNGSAIDFRLADDSGFSTISAGGGNFNGAISSSQGTGILSGVINAVSSVLTIVPAAGSANFRLFNTTYTINASGAQTGNTTGYFLNATETALNGMVHNLMDLQVGGVSKFKVGNTGLTTISTGAVIGGSTVVGYAGTMIYYSTQGSGTLKYSASGVWAFQDVFRLQVGGTTNLFPAIKRNGAGIDFRLADDSDYAGIIYKTLLDSPTVTAGAVTFDCNLADIFAITLVTGTPTAITLSNARAGSYVVNLKQPAGGSATVTWATTIVWAGGTVPTLTTTANYLDIVTLIYDGTTWRGTATLNFAS